MLESILRATQSLWLFMAIPGHCELPRESSIKPCAYGVPSGRPCAVNASSTHPQASPPVPAAETVAISTAVHHVRTEDEDALPANLPPAIGSEIKSIEASRLAIETRNPVERWRFDSVRARYQALLKTASGERALEAAIHVRLERLTRHEQAAKAAATIQTILTESHRRDREVVELKRQLQTTTEKRTHSRLYQAIGFMQPSAQKIDGRKLFVLIGKNGGTVAYLDIPPGLDPEPALARKVGVRGVAHYEEELHSRLIIVRDLQPIEARR
jgi:hypothetical protein